MRKKQTDSGELWLYLNINIFKLAKDHSTVIEWAYLVKVENFVYMFVSYSLQ